MRPKALWGYPVLLLSIAATTAAIENDTVTVTAITTTTPTAGARNMTDNSQYDFGKTKKGKPKMDKKWYDGCVKACIKPQEYLPKGWDLAYCERTCNEQSMNEEVAVEDNDIVMVHKCASMNKHNDLTNMGHANGNWRFMRKVSVSVHPLHPGSEKKKVLVVMWNSTYDWDTPYGTFQMPYFPSKNPFAKNITAEDPVAFMNHCVFMGVNADNTTDLMWTDGPSMPYTIKKAGPNMHRLGTLLRVFSLGTWGTLHANTLRQVVAMTNYYRALFWYAGVNHDVCYHSEPATSAVAFQHDHANDAANNMVAKKPVATTEGDCDDGFIADMTAICAVSGDRGYKIIFSPESDSIWFPFLLEEDCLGWAKIFWQFVVNPVLDYAPPGWRAVELQLQHLRRIDVRLLYGAEYGIGAPFPLREGEFPSRPTPSPTRTPRPDPSPSWMKDGHARRGAGYGEADADAGAGAEHIGLHMDGSPLAEAPRPCNGTEECAQRNAQPLAAFLHQLEVLAQALEALQQPPMSLQNTSSSLPDPAPESAPESAPKAASPAALRPSTASIKGAPLRYASMTAVEAVSMTRNVPLYYTYTPDRQDNKHGKTHV